MVEGTHCRSLLLPNDDPLEHRWRIKPDASWSLGNSCRRYFGATSVEANGLGFLFGEVESLQGTFGIATPSDGKSNEGHKGNHKKIDSLTA